MNYMKLQNGSDVRGVAMGEKKNLTAKICADIAFAFGEFLKQNSYASNIEPLVAVGHDSRLTATELAMGTISGLNAAGCKVVFTALSSTPAMFMSCKDESFNADGAIMLTASHLPKDRNGMKFFTKEGGLSKADIKNLLELAQESSQENVETTPKYTERQYLSEYADMLCDKIKEKTESDLPFVGQKILVDAGGGVAGFFATVLERLGADTIGSLYLAPDGHFSGHVPNPEDDDALIEISKNVIDTNADLAVVFDTDGDRAAFIGKGGVLINKNKLIALSAAIVAKGISQPYIVTDSVTSTGLTDFLEQELGAVHHRFKRGYKNVIDEAIRLTKEGKNAPLGIETSGHAALSENFFLDDGAYLAVVVLSALANEKKKGRELLDLISTLKLPIESKSKRFTIQCDDYKTCGEEIIEAVRALAVNCEAFELVSPNYEGIRVNVQKGELCGWFLLRLSLHDPVVVLDCESDIEGGIVEIHNMLTPVLEKFPLKTEG